MVYEIDTDITELGMGERLEGALCYLFGPITGLIFFLCEKHNDFVRFHALQSMFLSVIIIIIHIFITVIGSMSFIYWIVWAMTSLLSLGELLLWIFLMLKAYQHVRFVLPIIGEVADRYVHLII